MSRIVSKNNPLLEITLRKFEKPSPDDRRELLRKFCISIGMLQPGDSRDIIIDILEILLEARKTKNRLTSSEINKIVLSKRESLKDMRGIAYSNVRRHLKRLKEMNIIEKINETYRIKEWLGLGEIMKEYISPLILEPTIERIHEYADEIDKNF